MTERLSSQLGEVPSNVNLIAVVDALEKPVRGNGSSMMKYLTGYHDVGGYEDTSVVDIPGLTKDVSGVSFGPMEVELGGVSERDVHATEFVLHTGDVKQIGWVISVRETVGDENQIVDGSIVLDSVKTDPEQPEDVSEYSKLDDKQAEAFMSFVEGVHRAHYRAVGEDPDVVEDYLTGEE